MGAFVPTKPHESTIGSQKRANVYRGLGLSYVKQIGTLATFGNRLQASAAQFETIRGNSDKRRRRQWPVVNHLEKSKQLMDGMKSI
jgi:hypothetical protein